MSNTHSNLINTSARSTTLIYTRDADSLMDVVKNWHDDTHPDPRQFCMLQPCHAIQDLNREVVGQGGLHR
jgi:hypothetical protein